MSDTFVTASPHWTWYIIPYFFVGGVAGGAYFLAAVLEWFGRPEDRPVIRTGYSLAFWGAVLSGLLLTLDLGRSLRFWHMIFQSEHFPSLMFKSWSPISFGAWAILLFGALFLASGASTGAAALALFAPGRGAAQSSLRWLSSFDTQAFVVELLLLIVFLVSLGSVAKAWLSVWGFLLVVGVVGAGILWPLRLHFKPAGAGALRNPAVMVLVGGFLLRVVVLLASNSIQFQHVASGSAR